MFTFQIDQCYYVLPLTNTSLPSAARTNIVLPQFTGCKYMCITSQSEQRFLPTTHGAAWSMDQETLKVLSVVGSLFFFSCCVNFSHSPKVLDVISYHCNFDFSQGHFSQLVQAFNIFLFYIRSHSITFLSTDFLFSLLCSVQHLHKPLFVPVHTMFWHKKDFNSLCACSLSLMLVRPFVTACTAAHCRCQARHSSIHHPGK